jgi:hypothetical protein
MGLKASSGIADRFKLAADQGVPARIDEEIRMGKRESVWSQPRWLSSHFKLAHGQTMSAQTTKASSLKGLRRSE